MTIERSHQGGKRQSDSRYLGQLIGRVESSMSRSPHDSPWAVDVEPLASKGYLEATPTTRCSAQRPPA